MTADASAALLDRAVAAPAMLVIEGEAGIGKTTRWIEGVEQARRRGFLVLSARSASTEVTLTFGALADLIADVDPAVIDDLPSVQRVALQRVTLPGGDGPPSDERMVAAAFLAVLQRSAAAQPVLVAIDDTQWLDAATRTVLGYAAEGFRGGSVCWLPCAPVTATGTTWRGCNRLVRTCCNASG